MKSDDLAREEARIPPSGPPYGGRVEPGRDEPLLPAEVRDLLASLEKAVRARRLYDEANPAYQAFVKDVRERFGCLWSRAAEVQVEVEEHAFRWESHSFAVAEGRESLPFLFYKDGIRELSFLPGFEDEVEAFLAVVHRGSRPGGEHFAEDLVSVLWEQQFSGLRYAHLDSLADGVDVPEAKGVPGGGERLPAGLLEGDLSREAEALVRSRAGQPSMADHVSRDDFEPTLYVLDTGDMERARAEIQREMERPVKADVANALLDRLSDPITERRREIVEILRQLLPSFLAEGDLEAAALVVGELMDTDTLAPLDQATRAEAEGLFASLNDPAAVDQLASALLDGSIDPPAEQLGSFLAHLRTDALPLLLRRARASPDAPPAQRLVDALGSLASRNPEVLVLLLGDADPAVVAAGVGLASGSAHPRVITALAELLHRPETRLRRLSVDALTRTRTAQSIQATLPALEDPDMEVRVAAASGLAAVGFTPAAPRLREAIDRRLLKDGDRAERVAFLEALAALDGEAGVALLDRILNGRRLVGRHSPDLRACAAEALGRVGTTPAREVLLAAAEDDQPLVRNAVSRALAGPGPGDPP